MLSSGAGHVPALSGPLSTVPSSQGSGCPPLPPARGDELEAVSFHHRTSVGASGRSRSIWCPDGTQLRRSDRLGSPMHEYKPAGPCHGRGFGTHAVCPTGVPSGLWRRTPGCVPNYDREVTPEQTSHQEVRETTAATGRTMRPQSVPVNVYEAPEALIVVAPFPAVTPDDVTIELSPAILRISARLRSSGPREYLLREWEYGGYEREIDLPQGYGSRVEASLTNGQLVVRVLRGPLAGPLSMRPS